MRLHSLFVLQTKIPRLPIVYRSRKWAEHYIHKAGSLGGLHSRWGGHEWRANSANAARRGLHSQRQKFSHRGYLEKISCSGHLRICLTIPNANKLKMFCQT